MPFHTTSDLEPLDAIIGQDRAVEAIRLGIGIRRPGFNVVAFGPAGHGKLTTIQRFLDQEAAARPAPDGWCLVHDFAEGVRPRALRLPPGGARQLRDQMQRLVEDLLAVLPRMFAGEERRKARDDAYGQYEQGVEDARREAERKAAEMRIGIVWSDEGRAPDLLALDDDGEPLAEDAFDALPVEARQELERSLRTVREDLDQADWHQRKLWIEAVRGLAAAEREMAGKLVLPRMEQLLDGFGALEPVRRYVTEAGQDIIDHLELFQATAPGAAGDEPRMESSAAECCGGAPDACEAGSAAALELPVGRRRRDPRLRRYAVNVLVDHDAEAGAPVIYESHPTLANLVGYVGFEDRLGARHTDHTLVRAGALHRANGGFLVLEASEVLTQAETWAALKRALRGGRICIEAPGCDGTAQGLEPEPIPLSVKVVLVSTAGLFMDLDEGDPDFPELFKIGAEFSPAMLRDDASELAYARFLTAVIRREEMLPFDREAVARTIEHAARLAGDAQLLSSDLLRITDVLREVDHLARTDGRAVAGAADVSRAIDAHRRRVSAPRDEELDLVRRSVVQVDTTGVRCGAVNALVVLGPGSEFEFAMPQRVSARVRLGGGEVVDIEREADLGGPMHSKGVLVLHGFLGGRYLPDEQLAMSASLTFEAGMAEVDGPSASVAELVAVLSALAEVPVRQDIAVSGSIGQDGSINAVGGTDHKIEGFYDACVVQGLTGQQGVVIPHANVQQLMLRPDVLEAVARGAFHVYGATHVDEVIELLSGLPAGERQPDGAFPAGSFNRCVEDRLAQLAEKRRDRSGGSDGDDGGTDWDAAARRRSRRRQGIPRRGPAPG